MFALIIILALFVQSSLGIIGYDCASRNMNVTTMSLLDVGNCELPDEKLNVSRTYIQLLQINEFSEINVIQCKIEITRTIYYCGMHSHISLQKNGYAEYIQEINKETCLNIINTGSYKLDNRLISGITVNEISFFPVIFNGKIHESGYCEGAAYSDPYGSWDSVVVQGSIKIKIQQQKAQVKIEENKIYLKSGTICELISEKCIDAEGGYTFWSSIPTDNCKFDRYGVLYEGYANKITNTDTNSNEIFYSLSSDETTFALSSKGIEFVCGYRLSRTEHPRLVIFETVRGESFASKNKIATSNLDIFTYVNSKFIYVEKHIRSQVESLYYDALMQRCKLEQANIKNALAIASQSPDQFAYNIMRGPGYMAVTAGEVIHIIKCVPVEVTIDATGDRCYAELKVNRKNSTFFLTPKTHILKDVGTEIVCSKILPAYYQIDRTWYKIMPHPLETTKPKTIMPSQESKWHYSNPSNLAISGIYTENDLQNLKNRIMFPVERPALLNHIARDMDNNGNNEDRTILRLLDENSMDRIIDSTWTKMWGKFTAFGTISAGVMSIIMIIQLLKFIIGTLVNGYSLHQAYGWSLHLLGSVCNAVANLLLYLSHSKKEKKNEKEEVITELQEVKIYPNLTTESPEPRTEPPCEPTAPLKGYLVR